MSSGTEAIDRKQRIRDRYRGVDTSELEVIPAKIVEGLGESTSIRRVAAYVRVLRSLNLNHSRITDICQEDFAKLLQNSAHGGNISIIIHIFLCL